MNVNGSSGRRESGRGVSGLRVSGGRKGRQGTSRRPGSGLGGRRICGRAAATLSIFVLPMVMAGPARAELPGASGGQVRSADLTAAPGDLSAPPTLGGFNVTADGNAVDVLVDNTTGLAGIHPLSEADFPEAQSQFATGPFGSGLATVFWPGAAGGNFGSLSTELGVPTQLQPIASQLNDPVKASAQYPAGPATSDYPAGAPGGAAVMHATAQPGGITAEGSMVDENPTAVFSYSSAKGTSSAVASDKATGQSAADLTGVSLLGGLVQIGSITSTAQAVSDGSTGTGSALTHVNDVTVLGQAASIGSDGLVLPNFPSALGALTGPVVQNAISQVISGLGLTITEFPSTQAANGSGFTATSGGVAVTIDPPSSAAPILEQAASVLAPLFPSQAAIIPTLPGLLQGLTVTITLGRATASSNASAPFSDNFNFNAAAAPPAAPTDTGSLGGPTGASSAAVVAAPSGDTGGGASTLSPTVAATPASSGGTGTGGGGGTGSSGTVAQPPSTLIGLSSPLGAGAILLGVLLALAAGYGLWRLGRMVLPTDAGPACPLGHDPT